MFVVSGLIAMIGVLLVLAAPAGAHEATFNSTTSVVCDGDGLVLVWNTSSWSFTEDAGRHPDIIVEMRADGGPWAVVGNGPFNEDNSRMLLGVAPIPDGAVVLDIRVTPDPTMFWEGTTVTGEGDQVTLDVPPFEQFCEGVPPIPTETPTPVPPTPTATPVPPTPTETPTPVPPTPTQTVTPVPPTASPVPPTPTPEETPSVQPPVTVTPTAVPPTTTRRPKSLRHRHQVDPLLFCAPRRVSRSQSRVNPAMSLMSPSMAHLR